MKPITKIAVLTLIFSCLKVVRTPSRLCGGGMIGIGTAKEPVPIIKIDHLCDFKHHLDPSKAVVEVITRRHYGRFPETS